MEHVGDEAFLEGKCLKPGLPSKNKVQNRPPVFYSPILWHVIAGSVTIPVVLYTPRPWFMGDPSLAILH